MNKPPEDLRTTGPLVGMVRRSRCETCSWPRENYLQIEDRPSDFLLDRAEAAIPGHMFNVRYPFIATAIQSTQEIERI